MLEIKKYLEETFEKISNPLYEGVYVSNLNKMNDQLYIIYYPNLSNMEEFIKNFCVNFDNKNINFHCYEILIITMEEVPYFRGCVEDRGIKFFNIMKIDNTEKTVFCGKPYFLQGFKMKKIIKRIAYQIGYSIKFIGYKNIV